MTSPRSSNVRLSGALLCLSGALLNTGSVGRLVDPDGVIEGTLLLGVVIFAQAVLVVLGIVLLVRGRLALPAPAPGLLLVGALCGVVAGSYGTFLAPSASSSSTARGEAGPPPILTLDELCPWLTAEEKYVGVINIDNAEAGLERALAGDDDGRIVEARERLAETLLRHGRNAEAIALYEAAHELALAAELPAGRVRRVLRALGIANLRVGETSHCLEMHNPESCIFPIKGAGVWSDPRGAIRARELFEEYLSQRPDDLDVRWLLNVAHMTAGTYPDEVREEWLIAPEKFASHAEIGHFRDIAGSLGVDAFNLAGGAIAEDFDGDGFVDLFTTTMDPCKSAKYFHNNGDGTFEDWSERAGLLGQLGGFNCMQADYDNDGLLDVLILRGAWLGKRFGRQRNSLLQQQPDGSFKDVTVASGLGRTALPTQAAAWADYDLDGDLDLLIGNEFFRSELFRNEGDGTFSEVAVQSGIDTDRCAKGVAWGDYDNDGDPDLFISNYGGLNRFYRNEGDGTFIDLAESLGLETGTDEEPRAAVELRRDVPSALGKNLAGSPDRDLTFVPWFWDYDNDGWLDLYVGSFGSSLAEVAADYMGEPSAERRRLRLYHNDGLGGFDEVSAELGLDSVRMPMGANFGDVNNDGFLDIYLGTGRPGYEFLVPNVLYLNRGGEGFVDVTTDSGTGHLQKGHGIAFADFDNDGDQDLFAQMGGFYPADAFRDALFENPGNSNHWITIVLRGVESNRFGMGARLEVVVEASEGERSIFAIVSSGGSFGASSLQQELGLGSAERVVRIEITWPGKMASDVYEGAQLDSFVEITEGSEALVILARERFQFP